MKNHENGDFVLKDLITNLPKNEKNYDKEDVKLMSLNAKAINMLFCALNLGI